MTICRGFFRLGCNTGSAIREQRTTLFKGLVDGTTVHMFYLKDEQ